MRSLIVLLALCAASCSPPAATSPAPTPPPTAPQAPAADLGPYTNAWDSSEFSRFRHTLHAAAPGQHTIQISATTNSPGGETVAVYPLREDGSRGGSRIVFVVADFDGENASGALTIPAEGLPVEVVVENASGRRDTGNYALTVTP